MHIINNTSFPVQVMIFVNDSGIGPIRTQGQTVDPNTGSVEVLGPYVGPDYEGPGVVTIHIPVEITVAEEQAEDVFVVTKDKPVLLYSKAGSDAVAIWHYEDEPVAPSWGAHACVQDARDFSG